VSGEIFGLSYNGLNQTATGAEITSSTLTTAGVGVFLYSNPFTGTFNVVNGQIVGVNVNPNEDYGPFFSADVGGEGLLLPNLWFGESGETCLNICLMSASAVVQYDPTNVEGGVGVISDTVTFGVATVPEPSTWAMLILGFCGVGFMTFRKEKMAFNAA
jgi:PEP-CTERM motif